MAIARYCPQCGTGLAADAQFCQGCGAPAPGASLGTQGTAAVSPTAPVTSATGASKPSTNAYACPRCHEVDAARKVSSVVNGETSFGTIGGKIVGGSYQFGRYGGPSVSGGVLNAATANQSAIGRALSPPNEPIFKTSWGVLSVLSVVVLALLAWGTLATSNPVGVVFLALIGVIVFFKMRENKKRLAQYKLNIPVWKQAMANWDNLYYCLRCDGIYYPGHPEIYRTNEMIDAIYHRP